MLAWKEHHDVQEIRPDDLHSVFLGHFGLSITEEVSVEAGGGEDTL